MALRLDRHVACRVAVLLGIALAMLFIGSAHVARSAVLSLAVGSRSGDWDAAGVALQKLHSSTLSCLWSDEVCESAVITLVQCVNRRPSIAWRAALVLGTCPDQVRLHADAIAEAILQIGSLDVRRAYYGAVLHGRAEPSERWQADTRWKDIFR